jgi:hypothetical protein
VRGVPQARQNRALGGFSSPHPGQAGMRKAYACDVVSASMRSLVSEADVPALVRRYLTRVLPAEVSIPRQVRVTQVGEMRRKPGGRWLRFSAVEEFAVKEVAFSWRARFRLAKLVSLSVVDGYAGGAGRLEARLLGLVPVLRARGPEVAEGEALRYLAELAWVPQAMAANRRLEWRELGAQTVEVATRVGSARVALRLEFDAAGDLVGAATDARPRTERKRIVPTPWAGSYSEYAAFDGIRVPTRAEVRWELTDGPFAYWRGRLTSFEVEAQT